MGYALVWSEPLPVPVPSTGNEQGKDDGEFWATPHSSQPRVCPCPDERRGHCCQGQVRAGSGESAATLARSAWREEVPYLILITSHQTRQRERRLSRLTVFEKQWRKSSATELAQLGNGHRLGLRAAATPSEEDSVMWSEGAIIPPSLGGTPPAYR